MCGRGTFGNPDNFCCIVCVKYRWLYAIHNMARGSVGVWVLCGFVGCDYENILWCDKNLACLLDWSCVVDVQTFKNVYKIFYIIYCFYLVVCINCFCEVILSALFLCFLLILVYNMLLIVFFIYIIMWCKMVRCIECQTCVFFVSLYCL